MKKTLIHSAIVLIATFAAVTAAGQSKPQIITVPLSRPGEQMTPDISILSARIEVIGEDRADAEFAVTVEQGSRRIITPSGSQPIAGGAYSLEVDEEDNHISVDIDWRVDNMSIVARIPRNSSLELSTVNDGEIIVSNIHGNLELDNITGRSPQPTLLTR